MESRSLPYQMEDLENEADSDYMRRFFDCLTELQTVASHSSPVEQILSPSSYAVHNPYGPSPSMSGPSPWSVNAPASEPRSLVTTSAGTEPNWRTSSSQQLNSIQRMILAEFPSLITGTDHRRTNVGASSVEEGFSRLPNTSDEGGVVSTSEYRDEPRNYAPVDPLDAALETSTDQTSWPQSVLDIATIWSPVPDDTRYNVQPRIPPITLSKQLHLAEGSYSGTPNSESLSSSFSDGETEHKSRHNTGECAGNAAGTSVDSGKRKTPEREEGVDPQNDEPQTKRPMARIFCRNRNRPRKKAGAKRVREPRIAIRTKTDVDVMDDGYKWRKYGQKAVKNSPHPRNYYRCTTPNCPVRKRVERSFEDPGLVVTTYEGTHTHQTPSLLRGPPGYLGGLGGLVTSPGSQYDPAGSLTLPPFLSNSTFSPLNIEPLRPPLWLSQMQPRGAIQENLNLLQAHELVRLQQGSSSWASIKNEPLQFRAEELRNTPHEGLQTNFPRPSGSIYPNVGTFSNQGYDLRTNQYNLPPSILEKIDTFPVEHSSSITAGSSISAKQNLAKRQVVESRGEYRVNPGEPSRQSAVATDEGLLEDMFKPTFSTISRG